MKTAIAVAVVVIAVVTLVEHWGDIKGVFAMKAAK